MTAAAMNQRTALAYGVTVEDVRALVAVAPFPRDDEGFFLDTLGDPERMDWETAHFWYRQFRRGAGLPRPDHVAGGGAERPGNPGETRAVGVVGGGGEGPATG